MLQFYEENVKGPIAQPSNAITSLAYTVVGFLLLKEDGLIAIAVIFLSLTTIFFHAKNTLLSQNLDIISIGILVILFAYRAFPFNQLNQTNLLVSVALILTASVFWIIDIKKLSIIPKNHILTGHGVWHILTALSVWFFYLALPNL